MENKQVANKIMAGTVGTTAMTAFSYVLSDVKDKNFREPRLLSDMIFRLGPLLQKDKVNGMGWLIHYSVGILFAVTYSYLLKRYRVNANVKSGSLIGGITGLFAVAIWHFAFRLHPPPPRTHYRKFYGQLIVAHIIFGAVTVLLLSRNNKRTASKNYTPIQLQ